MEEPIREMGNLRIVESDAQQIIDVSFTEVPSRITCKINMGSVLGGLAFLAMLLTPGAIESEKYILALGLLATFGVCAYLSVKEEGKRK